MQMVNDALERCSPSLVTREMQVTVRHYFTLPELATALIRKEVLVRPWRSWGLGTTDENVKGWHHCATVCHTQRVGHGITR